MPECVTVGCVRPGEYGHLSGRCGRCRMLASRYGIDPALYYALLAVQDGRCAICGNRPRTRALHLDHNHKTGLTRGLLCSRCNHGLLGSAHESAVILQRAIDYLNDPPAGRLAPPPAS